MVVVLAEPDPCLAGEEDIAKLLWKTGAAGEAAGIPKGFLLTSYFHCFGLSQSCCQGKKLDQRCILHQANSKLRKEVFQRCHGEIELVLGEWEP